MLIISRKLKESLFINSDVEIIILDIQNDRIRLGIEAPKHVKILRKELIETEKANIEALRSAEDTDYNALKSMIRNKE